MAGAGGALDVVSQTHFKEAVANLDIDDSVVGGARIRVGDNVIDGSIATRLSDLRNTLAG